MAKAAEKLFEEVTKLDPSEQGTYTLVDSCGGEARNFYNSSSYMDELIWAGTWLFYATGNTSYLAYATDAVRFQLAQSKESSIDRGIFDWNNKFSATAVTESKSYLNFRIKDEESRADECSSFLLFHRYY